MKKLLIASLAGSVLAVPLVAVAAPNAALPSDRPDATIEQLVAEALQNNAEAKAARAELAAAERRIAPAGALDDPMLEAGVVNLPTSSWCFRAEDMTMKM